MHEHLPDHETEKPQEHQQLRSSSVNEFNASYILPLAILVGALLISGAITYSARDMLKSLSLAPNAAATQQGNQQNKTAQAPAPGQKVDVGVGHLPTKGNPNAKVKLVAFEDFRCPFCEKFFTTTEPQIIKDYVDTGKAVIYYRQYQFLGSASVVAGNAAECANEQGKFWNLHDYLYQKQPSESDTSMYTTANLTKIAGQLGMNTGKFQSCLSSNKYDKNVQSDLAEGQAAGVTGTPTVFVNGIPVTGAQPYAVFKAAIEQQLSK